MPAKRPILNPAPGSWGVWLGKSVVLSWEWVWTQTFLVPTVYYTDERSYGHVRLGWLAGAIGIAWAKPTREAPGGE